MSLLNIGDVIELPVGMKVYHNQGKELMEIKVPAIVVIVSSREILPFNLTGAEGHFEPTGLLKGRALQPNGEYHPEGALLTFAQYGDFRKEFILPGTPNILRRMKQTFAV